MGQHVTKIILDGKNAGIIHETEQVFTLWRSIDWVEVKKRFQRPSIPWRIGLAEKMCAFSLRWHEPNKQRRVLDCRWRFVIRFNSFSKQQTTHARVCFYSLSRQLMLFFFSPFPQHSCDMFLLHVPKFQYFIFFIFVFREAFWPFWLSRADYFEDLLICFPRSRQAISSFPGRDVFTGNAFYRAKNNMVEKNQWRYSARETVLFNKGRVKKNNRTKCETMRLS